MNYFKVLSSVLLCFYFFTFTACSGPVDLKGFQGNTITVKGKTYTLKGKVKRDHDLIVNGMPVQLNPDKTFELHIPLTIGDNKFRLEVAPKRRDKDSNFRDITIKREMFPAEIEYHKTASHKALHRGDSDDFAIDKNYKYLAVVGGHQSPRVYDMQNGSLLKDMGKLEKDSGYEQTVTFTPDNKHILIGLYWGSLMYVINSEKFDSMKQFYIGGGLKFAISYATNAIITSCNGIWKIDPTNFKVLGHYQPSWTIKVISFDPTGKYILSESAEGIKITDADKLLTTVDYSGYDKIEQQIAKKSKTSCGSISAATWNNTGDGIIVGSGAGDIVVCKVSKDEIAAEVAKTNIGSPVQSIGLNKDMTSLVVATKNKIVILDYATLKTKLIFEYGAYRTVFSPNNDIFYYGNKQGVFEASLKNINWTLIEEYNRLKHDNVI